MAHSDRTRLLRCEECQEKYKTTRRFPESFSELLCATSQEWRWVLRRLFVSLIFFCWMYTLASHYVAVVSAELSVVLVFTSILMSISVGQRFHRGVQLIWSTPYKWRYFKLFAIYALLCYMASLRVLQPTSWATIAAQQPWLAALHELHVRIHASVSGTVFHSSFTAVYLSTTSGVIFLFWKTSLRVVTVADAEPLAQKRLMRSSSGGAHCGLCQLGLCLENTGM